MLTGKRQLGQLAAYDFALLLILAYILHNAIYAGGAAFYATIITAIMLMAVNYIVHKLSHKNKKNITTIPGEPQILIIDGMLFKHTMLETGITNVQINGAIKKHGFSSINQIHLAILETNGTISIFANEKSAYEQ